MGLVYAAELRPGKMELVAGWLPSQPWFEGDAATLVRLGSFRFDDPEGEVGIETHVVGASGRVYQVPLTYRGAALEGAEAFLLGTMEHSVLGKRWIYDATADPVYAGELAAALFTGKPQAEETRVTDGRTESLPRTAELACIGSPDAVLPELRFTLPSTTATVTTIPVGAVNLSVLRKLDTTGSLPQELSLTATWAGQDTPVQIATAATS